MNVYLNLTFGTAEGKAYNLRVPNASDSADSLLVKNAMDALIEANCIKTSSGDITSREKAQRVTVYADDFDLS